MSRDQWEIEKLRMVAEDLTATTQDLQRLQTMTEVCQAALTENPKRSVWAKITDRR